MNQQSQPRDYRSLMQSALLELKEMRAKLEAFEQAKTEPIAIIGMGCRFPGGADSAEAFWQLLQNGVDAIAEVPPDRWNINAYFDPDPEAPGKMYTRYGGFIDQLHEFDATFFGISPREALSLDPQQRLLLEVSWEALENAAIIPAHLNSSQTGVFIGITSNDYSQHLLSREQTEIDAYLATGNSHSTAAGRLSYTLGFVGPSVAVDTACSSSLVAVHLACQSLRNKECNMALVGGVSRLLSPEFTINFSKARMLSPDGRCKTFDAAADGFVRAEGCGVVILKRLSDAITDDDNIIALIRGSAVNQDGRCSGLTVPNGPSQQAVILQALKNGNLDQAQVSYVEAHGTGTALGDPIEVNALLSVFGKHRHPDQPLAIGSVKTNIGHLEAAAGIAGLIKVVLCLQNQEIPPHLHFHQPNPHIPWNHAPIQVITARTPWLANHPRFAGVSSFGFSGTNAHVVLSEGGSREDRSWKSEGGKIEVGNNGSSLQIPNSEFLIDRPLHLLTLSAKTPLSLQQLATRYEQYLTTNPTKSIADICFSANTGRSHFEHRLGIIANSTTSAREKLAEFISGKEPIDVFQGQKLSHQRPKIAFVFAAQGSQLQHMGWQLYSTQPTFRKALNQCDQLLQPYIKQSLLEILYPNTNQHTENPKFNQTAFAQSALFALEYALYKLWTSWGIQPDVVMGHSFGEYVAACVAGVFSLEDALKLVAHARLEVFHEVANSIKYSEPQIEMISSRTGSLAGDEVAIPQYWCEHIFETARFSEEMQTLAQQSCDICITLESNSDWQVVLSSLAKLYVNGVEINWQAFDQDYQRHRVLLPNYAFERQRYWIEVDKAKSPRADKILHPLLGQKLNLAKSAAIHFENQISRSSPVYLQHHQVFETTIFPAAGYLEMALAAGNLLLTTDALIIEDVDIQQALVLPESEVKTIQMVLVPHSEQGYSFEILSLVTGDEEKWVIHATGKVRVNNDIQNPPVADLATRQAQYDEQAITPAAYYQMLQEKGIDYGESFSAIAQLFSKQNQALGQIQLPKQFTNNTYKIHPVLLDAALQVIGAALHRQVSEIYLPVGLERFTYYGNTGDCLWSSVQVHPQQSTSGELLSADVQLMTSNGKLIATVSGLKLRKTNPKAMFGGEPESFSDWLYTVEWRSFGVGGAQEAGAEYVPSPEVVRAHVVPTLDRLLNQVELQAYRELLPQLEQLSIAYVLNAFESLNWQFLFHQRFTTAQLIQDLAIAPQHQQLCARLLQMLMEAGILQQQDNYWQVVQQPQKIAPETQQQSLLTHYQIANAELTLLHRCGSNLAQVLQGKTEPLQLLFPQGDITTLTQLYQDSPGAKLMNTLVQQVVQFALEHKPQHRRVRILEIGAGTGGTTAYLLPHLDPAVTEYTFSDISPLFTHKAQQKFQDYSFVQYMVLDIERSPQSQNLELQNYDIIIAANVLHATSTLHQTLTHVQQLLTPGGMLVLLESTQPLRWLDLIFGLTEGWWRFTDRDLRPSHPLLSVARWQQLLQDCGFEQIAAIEPEQQAIIVAQTAGIRIPNSTKWMILSDQQGLGQELAKLLQAQGQNCILVFPGQDYQQLDEQRYQINPMHQTEFLQLFEHLTLGAMRIVHLWSLDTPAAEGLSIEHLNAIAKLTCGSALNLVQSLVKTKISPSSLWLVTQGTVSIAATDKESGIMQSPLWGLGKVIALEHPEIGGFRVDLDPTVPLTEQASLLQAEILSAPKEDQVAFRNQIRYVPRLVNSSQKNLHRSNLLEIPKSQPFRLGISTRGTIENLQLQPMQRRAPQVGEVEIQISATGLNFIDVLDALNLLPFERNWFGVECAGEIVAVGAGVEHLKLGDAVIALAPESFSQFVTTNAAMVILKPEILSFEEAATIPANFLTAYYALHQVANITQGSRILIHAAAGGTGMAAVQLAQQAGAEVFATASPSKWEKLKAMGVKHLFNSRTLDFAEGVMALTQGEGVDIVLNSLSGDFIAKSLSVLKAQGRFLEIGKRDVWSHTQVQQLQPNVSYALVDLMTVAQQQPDLIQSMLRYLMQLFQACQLQPLPRTVFPIQQAIHAFRYMQQAKHIGKVVIANDSFNGTYLITGGLGGLGLLVADWLVQQGARHLVLVSRRAVDAEISQRLQSLKQAGAEVMVVQADVADESQLANVLSTIKSSLPPLRGVIHAAGVLDDGVLQHLTWERFATVLHPKMLGAWNLHNLTQEQPLDFFVLFSSAASLLGSPGQANHVAANTFLDALAHYRQARGLPGLSINWGAWSSVGAAAKRGVSQQMRLRGVAEIAPQQGLQIFAQLLFQSAAQVGVIPIQWTTFLQQGISSPLFADFLQSEPPKSTQQSHLLQQLAKANTSDRPAMLIAYLQTEVGKVLGLPSTQLPALKQGFFDLGMDSLMMVELRNRLETSLGISIPSTAIFEYPTIQDLGEHLAQLKFGIMNSELRSQNSEFTATTSVDTELIEELAGLEKLLGKN